MQPPRSGSYSAVFALFLLSGATGLIYEVVWLRQLVLIFGSTQFATSTILAALENGAARVLPVESIETATRLVSLSDRARDRVGSFSTGMQRRLVIAKAVFQRYGIPRRTPSVKSARPSKVQRIARVKASN